ncbi:hypothetical protein N0V93_004135 [Gnomoniopsis smithogilvyi]|uniref:Uncharacterized protein n=1 Tax=Gnomoniopsis smithogilvyi TaxID=1191159 RepID=A0A9W8YU79_9PEZI|nr:hypothetical protein N0V93_004135 [Gnomoniopsis smithogilvyi]
MLHENKIKEAAARNASLLRTLHETRSALADLAEHNRYVKDLERQAADFGEQLKQLGDKRMRELKEHKSYRDSVVRRLAYKAARKKEKFEAKAAKEAREYFDALEDEEQAHVMKTNLDAMLEEAKTAQCELEAKAAVHTEAQKDLDRLYDYVFQDPIPGFPEVEERAREMQTAAKSYHHAQSRAEAEWQAVQCLRQAHQHLNAALIAMDTALRRSSQDMYGGGTYIDIMERNALCQANEDLLQARKLVTLARRGSPYIRELPPVAIAQGNLLGDVLFDNIFSDMGFHGKIKQSAFEVQNCARDVSVDLQTVTLRHVEICREAEIKSAAMRKAKASLQKSREAVFSTLKGQYGTVCVADEPAPPTISAPKQRAVA